MNKEEQIGTLVGLDLILSPEHYKEITKLQQENKQLKEDFSVLKKSQMISNDILNELEGWLYSYMPLLEAGDIVETTTQDTLKEVLDKIQELKEKYK